MPTRLGGWHTHHLCKQPRRLFSSADASPSSWSSADVHLLHRLATHGTYCSVVCAMCSKDHVIFLNNASMHSHHTCWTVWMLRPSLAKDTGGTDIDCHTSYQLFWPNILYEVYSEKISRGLKFTIFMIWPNFYFMKCSLLKGTKLLLNKLQNVNRKIFNFKWNLDIIFCIIFML